VNTQPVPDEAGWTEHQEAGLAALHSAFQDGIVALKACLDAGLEPAQALVAVGMNIPTVVQPMLNVQLHELLADENIPNTP